MFKEIKVHATFNERTGYGIHGSRFFSALIKLHEEKKNGSESGEVHISLLDTVTASQINEFPPQPSILYNVWESSLQPDEFIYKLKNYSQLWVASEAQKAWSVAQGVPEEFIRVVPEGVDPDVYYPIEWTKEPETFNFIHVGQFQYRKSTKEICECFLKAFPIKEYPNVSLYLSVDTLFPSDPYKSTEERMEAYGFTDPRFIIVHFEERPDYIKRLQTSHVFVSCSRSEGFYLPGIEAMACGIPTILADYGGSTEYGEDALLVRVPQLKKPQEIYGNWNVPGEWGEPDYNHLVEVMKDAYDNYEVHKVKALKTSDKIRDKFSWTKAAEKAIGHLEQLHKEVGMATNVSTNTQTNTATICNPESDIRAYALKHGFRITSMEKESSCFVIGCWPSSQEKMDTLIETIAQIKPFGCPIIISTHYALPAPIMELVDYVIYEKKNILSDDWRATYVRTNQSGQMESKPSTIPYHGVACLNAIRNAVDFCHGKFDRINYLEFDCEADLDKFIPIAVESDSPFTGINYEGKGLRTDIWSAKVDFLFAAVPKISSWAEYIAGMDNINTEYPLEFWLYKKFLEAFELFSLNLIDFEVTNRFDQVDRNLWPDDVFQLSFFDGATLNISGISNREYNVNYRALDRNIFDVRQKVGMWSKPEPKFYLPWVITASLNGEEKYRHEMNLEGKNILIQMGSKALGDTIAWMPYVDEFRKKHNCHVICSGWWQEIFDYPEIQFIKPGAEVRDIYSAYVVGCFDNQLDKNPINWRDVPLQKVAADILGLEYKPIRARLKNIQNTSTKRNLVCFSEYSTMQNKLWNRPGAWQKVVDYLVSIGYECVSISAEPSQLNNVTKHNGQSIQATIADIRTCDFYIGLNHGPVWIAHALGIPAIMITGVSEEWNDFPNPYRIAINNEVCGKGCFNDKDLPIDRGWSWCPRNKEYACTKEITEAMVISMIDKLRGDKNVPVKKRKKSVGNKSKHSGGNGSRKISKAGRGNSAINSAQVQ
jgi:autotransporter strand-loop-strand O-heptosyltransferase